MKYEKWKKLEVGNTYYLNPTNKKVVIYQIKKKKIYYQYEENQEYGQIYETDKKTAFRKIKPKYINIKGGYRL